MTADQPTQTEQTDEKISLAAFEILYRKQRDDPTFSARDFAGSSMILRGLAMAVGGVDYLLKDAKTKEPEGLLYVRTDNLAYMVNLLTTGQLTALESLPAEQAHVIRAVVNDAKERVIHYFMQHPGLTAKLSPHTCQSFGLEQAVVPLADHYAGRAGTTQPTK